MCLGEPLKELYLSRDVKNRTEASWEDQRGRPRTQNTERTEGMEEGHLLFKVRNPPQEMGMDMEGGAGVGLL